MNSRAKGCRGELEASKEWARVVGGRARRGQQFSGGGESPDVVCSQPDIHLEVKRTERGNPYQWMDQAVRDAGGKCPVVLHRRNGKPWLLLVRLDDAPRLAKALAPEVEEVGGHSVSLALPGACVPETIVEDGAEPGVFPLGSGRGSRCDLPGQHTEQRDHH